MTERYHLIIEQSMLTAEEERMQKIKKSLAPQQTARLAEIKAKLSAMPPKYYFDPEDITAYEQLILKLATKMVDLAIDAKTTLQQRSTDQWTKAKLTKVRCTALFIHINFNSNNSLSSRKRSKPSLPVWTSPSTA